MKKNILLITALMFISFTNSMFAMSEDSKQKEDEGTVAIRVSGDVQDYRDSSGIKNVTYSLHFIPNSRRADPRPYSDGRIYYWDNVNLDSQVDKIEVSAIGLGMGEKIIYSESIGNLMKSIGSSIQIKDKVSGNFFNSIDFTITLGVSRLENPSHSENPILKNAKGVFIEIKDVTELNK